MRKTPAVCYLCGHPLTAPTSGDHVPPRQLYAKEVRKANQLDDLLLIDVHDACNKAYQLDEDYFFNTLAPFGLGTYAGDAFHRGVLRKFERGENRGLVRKVIREFETEPGGIILPPGLVLKRPEGKRVQRVAWKIVRGLYFHEFDTVLPDNTPHTVQVIPPDTVPPAAFLHALFDLPSRGQHPGVFDYKYLQVAELNGFNYWGLLLWGNLILIVAFHGLGCTCEHCLAIRPSVANPAHP